MARILFDNIKNLFIRYSYAGVLGNKDTEIVRKVYLINLFGFVGILFSLPLAVSAALNHKLQLSFFLLLTSAFCLGNHFYLKKTLDTRWASNILLYTLFTLMIFLVASGGVNNTGPLWVYTFPAVALFLHGFKKGLCDIAIFLIIKRFLPRNCFL